MPQPSNTSENRLDNVEELRPASDFAPTTLVRPTPAKPVAFQGRLRSLLMTSATAALLAGAVWFGWEYWTVGRFLVSTDDAYVMADSTTVAPKISGYLGEVLVEDNQTVMAGQVLTRIDDRDYRTALDQSKADVAAAEAAVTSKEAQLDVQRANIQAAKASIDVDKAASTFAVQENQRYTDLAKTGYGSLQNAQLAESRDASAMAAIERDKANLASADKQIELLKAEVTQATAAAARARAIQRQAALNLSYATITAPIDGVVGNRTLREGQYVQAGTQLMSLVPITGAYVIANFKETQLTNVRTGQLVTITVDTFPGKIVHGHVDSLAPASGQEFALLPPDNATGNFTKVVQRIPVKIALDGEVDVALRPGMSVIPTIQTRTQSGRALHGAATSNSVAAK